MTNETTERTFQFTPGPWEMPAKPYVQASDGEGYNFSGGDWEILPPLGEAGSVAIVNSEANARLIAAAPDLLAAAVRATRTGRYYGECRRDQLEASKRDDCRCVHCELKSAIAKALGDC